MKFYLIVIGDSSLCQHLATRKARGTFAIRSEASFRDESLDEKIF